MQGVGLVCPVPFSKTLNRGQFEITWIRVPEPEIHCVGGKVFSRSAVKLRAEDLPGGDDPPGRRRNARK